MRNFIVALVLILLQPAVAEDPAADDAARAEQVMAPQMSRIVMHKSPGCGCCAVWAKHLQSHGFEVESIEDSEVYALKEKLGIPTAARSCHTARAGQYVFEGHVPASDIIRLLTEQPDDVKGLAVPGMPLGSPGMEHPNPQYYRTIALMEDGTLRVYAEHHPNEDYAPKKKPINGSDPASETSEKVSEKVSDLFSPADTTP